MEIPRRDPFLRACAAFFMILIVKTTIDRKILMTCAQEMEVKAVVFKYELFKSFAFSFKNKKHNPDET
jgi:hypothetical protein